MATADIPTLTASPEIVAAFETWRLAMLAAAYAAPCLDEVMDSLTRRSGEAFAALAELPPRSPEDMLLKVFPLLCADMEGPRGAPPLRLGETSDSGYTDAFLDRLNDQLAGVSPLLRAAIEAPAPSRGEA